MHKRSYKNFTLEIFVMGSGMVLIINLMWLLLTRTLTFGDSVGIKGLENKTSSAVMFTLYFTQTIWFISADKKFLHLSTKYQK